MQQIFANEEINTERQTAFDFQKALLILSLPPMHLIIETAIGDCLDYGIPYFYDTILGGTLGAPIFMFAMGLCMLYTRHGTPKEFLKRGGKLFLMGFLLNFLRYGLPAVVGVAISGEKDHYFTDLSYQLFGNDILQFAGLAFMLVALFQRLKLPIFVQAGIALLMSIAGSALAGIHTDSQAWNILLGHILPVEDENALVMSDFPLLNWLIIVYAGYLFSMCLRRVRNQDRFYLGIGMVSAALGIPYMITGIQQARGMFSHGMYDFYHLRTIDAFFSIMILITELVLLYFLYRLLPEVLRRIIYDVSYNLNRIYCIHWVIVGFFARDVVYLVTGRQELTTVWALVFGYLISLISALLAHNLGKAVKQRRSDEAAK